MVLQPKSTGLTLNFGPQFLITLFVFLNIPLFSAPVQSNTFTFYALIIVNMLLVITGIATCKRVISYCIWS
jgi:hypothetical protein